MNLRFSVKIFSTNQISKPIKLKNIQKMNNFSSSSLSTTILKANAILNYLAGVELVFGLMANLLFFVVCAREKLRKIPTFTFIMFISLSNLSQILVVTSISFVNQVLSGIARYCMFILIYLFVLNASVMGLEDIKLSSPNATLDQIVMICLAPFSLKEYYAQVSIVNFLKRLYLQK